MFLNILYKSCPSCKEHLPVNLFSYSGKIFRCPKCGTLVADDPKRNWYGFFLMMLGFVGAVLVRNFGKSTVIADILIITLCWLTWMFLKRLMIVKKELVIKNKATNELSYINQSDWEEIVANAAGKENSFEITEHL